MVSCSLKDPLNFLYDYEANPFRRDSLGHLNGMPESGFNQWGLLYPNAFGLYPNRRKKLEKQPSNERAQKDSLNKVPTKKELLDWLKNMSLQQRYQVFCIEDSCLVIILLFMYRKWTENKEMSFAIESSNRNVASTKNFFDFQEIQKWLHFRKSSKLGETITEQQKHAAEAELIENLRICDGEEFYDTLVFQESFLENFERIIEIFEIISDGSAFSAAPKPYWNSSFKTYVCEGPQWFNPWSFQRIGTWIASNFEKAIWLKYFEESKTSTNKGGVTVDSKITLEYKQDLVRYWKQLKAESRNNVFSVAPELLTSLKAFELPKNEEISEELLSDTKYRLGLFYACFKAPADVSQLTPENIVNKLKAELQDKNSEKFIENLLQTDMKNFGKLTNVISRIIAERIKAGLSDQFARELSNEDTKEKTQAVKNSKKKKNKKNGKKKQKESTNEHTPKNELSFLQELKETKKQENGDLLEETKSSTPILVEESHSSSMDKTAKIDFDKIPCNCEPSVMCEAIVQLLINKAVENSQNSKIQQLAWKLLKEPIPTVKSPEATATETKAQKKKNKKKKKAAEAAAQQATKTKEPEILNTGDVVLDIGQDSDQEESKEGKSSKPDEVKLNESDDNELVFLESQNKKTDRNRKKKQKKRLNKLGQKLQSEKKDFESVQSQDDLEKSSTCKDCNAAAAETLWDQTTTDNTSVNRDNSRVESEKHALSTPSPSSSDISGDHHSRKLSGNIINDLTQKLGKTIEKQNKKSGAANSKNSKEEKKSSKSEVAEEKGSFKKPVAEVSNIESAKKSTEQKVSQQTTAIPQLKTELKPMEQNFEDFIEVKPNKKKAQKPAGNTEHPKRGHRGDGPSHKSDRTGGGPHRKEEKNHKQSDITTTKQSVTSTTHSKGQEASTEVKKNRLEKLITSYNSIIERNSTPESTIVHKSKTVVESDSQGSTDFETPKKQPTEHKHEAAKPIVKDEIVRPNSVPMVSENLTLSRDSSDNFDKESCHSESSSLNQTPSRGSETKGKKCLRLNPKKTPLAIQNADIESVTISNFVNKLFEMKLEEDIFNYVYRATKESNKMMGYRIAIFDRLSFVITKSFPSFPLMTKLYGSCATGFALNTSDVDIAISGFGFMDRMDVVIFLQSVQEKLSKFAWIKSITPIFSAAIPVLKLDIDPSIDFLAGDVEKDPLLESVIEQYKKVKTEKLKLNLTKEEKEESPHSIKVDLTVEYLDAIGGTSHLGILSTEFVLGMNKKYCSLYTITVILKRFLRERGYLNNHLGGLSSYSLTVLLVAYFKQNSDQGFVKSLQNLLEYFGKKFDPATTGINLTLIDKTFFELPIADSAPLTMFDTINFGRNIGQNSHKFKQIQQEFCKVVDYFEEFRAALTNLLSKISWVSIKTLEDLKARKDPELLKFLEVNTIEEVVQRL